MPFKKRPTWKERSRLRQIVDPSQKAALMDAIKHGESIPEYAWTPVPSQDGGGQPDTSSLLSMVADMVASADEAGRATLISVAEEIRPSVGTGDPWLLNDPLVVQYLPLSRTAISTATVLEWGVFHPLGPLVCWLVTVPVPGTSEQLICLRRTGPALEQYAAYGMLPGRDLREELARSLEALFARNGDLEVPLIEGPPSYVSVPYYDSSGELLSREALRGFFWDAMAGQVDDADLHAMTTALLATPDPRERVGDGVAEERLNVSVARSARVMRRFLELEYPGRVARLNGASHEAVEAFYAELAAGPPVELRRESTRPLQRETFEKWFTAVADDDHAEREQRFTLNAEKRQTAALLRPGGIIIPEYEYSDE